MWNHVVFAIGKLYLFDMDFLSPTDHDFSRWKRHLFDILLFISPGLNYLNKFNWVILQFKFEALIFVLNWRWIIQWYNDTFYWNKIRKYNWHNNKNTDGLVNRLASNLVILNQAHRGGSMANRARKKSEIVRRTREGKIYSYIIKKMLRLGC